MAKNAHGRGETKRANFNKCNISKSQKPWKHQAAVMPIIIALCAIICNGNGYADMEAFGREKEKDFRTFLELPDGMPHVDTFRRVFERLNPQELIKMPRGLDRNRAKR